MFKHLIERGLVKEKSYPNGLSVFKYSRNVFYDALWNEDPLLLEARGMVLDSEGNKVIWPFTKVFNYGENGTTLPLNTPVIAPIKVNGFMASVTRYQGEILVATTGTLDSDYVGYAKEMTANLDFSQVKEGYTFLFEIVHPKDPHIIDEPIGAYLIGCRRHETGAMATEASLDNAAYQMYALRPLVFECTFGEVVELSKLCQHEGFMIRLNDEHQTIVMKIKSPHYLVKKFLMRMGGSKSDLMANNPEQFKKTVDEEYYPLIDFVSVNYRQSWKDMKEQDRRKVIEDYFND